MTTLAIAESDHTRGSSDASATILVYGDYECPYTRAFEQTLARLRRSESDTFRSVFRYFPLREIHPHAQAAAEAAESVFALAGADAFWVMHDALFAHQDDLEEAGLERRGVEAGVDAAALRSALQTHQSAKRVEHDVTSGFENGVNGTPSIFINGERYRGPRDVEGVRRAIAKP